MPSSRAWSRATTPPVDSSTLTTALAAKADTTTVNSALALKAPLASPTFTGTVAGITKSHVGLGNVDNTADSAKPVSTAQAAADALRALAADVAFTKSYESAQQTITSSGLLTLAHGMGVAPKVVQLFLVCQVAELNYSVGDVLSLSAAGLASGTTADRGVSAVSDATNITIRLGGNLNSLIAVNKLNGNSVSLTNANWKLVVRAWA